MRRILHKLQIDDISAVDRPAQEPARAVIMKRDNFGTMPLTPEQAFWKLSSDSGAISFCKMILDGRIDPFTKATWERIIEIQAVGNYEGCSKAQSVSRYLCSEVGRWLFQAAKAAPLEKGGSTPMDVISDSDARAYMAAATALERGRAGRERAAMRPDITPRSGAGEDNNQGGSSDAHQEARARAARRHAANPARAYEQHYSDAIAADPQLASRVLAEERSVARKSMPGRLTNALFGR